MTDYDKTESRWNPLLRGLLPASIALALFYGGAFLYTKNSGPLLKRTGRSVGSVMMKEAQRLELGGDAPGAETAYRAALAAGFTGPEDRTFTEKHLGILLLASGRMEEAASHLQTAVSLRPGTELLAFAPLCEALLALGRHAELERTAEAWKSAHRVDAIAKAHACALQGKSALAQGNDTLALQRFKEGAELSPGSEASGELGLFYFKHKQYDEARPQLEAYLLHGATNNTIQAAYEALPAP